MQICRPGQSVAYGTGSHADMSVASLDARYSSYLEILADVEDHRAALLAAFGAHGTYPDELEGVVRQAAQGNPDAVRDIKDLCGDHGQAILDYLASGEGRRRRLAAQALLDDPEAFVPPQDCAPQPGWVPSVRPGVQHGPQGSGYGGGMAWMAADASWPLHHDGGPMSLLVQLDLDTLPQAARARLGLPGHLFQLFVPTGLMRGLPATVEGWATRCSPCEVRLVDKEQPGSQVLAPWTHPLDDRQIPVSSIQGWREHPDCGAVEGDAILCRAGPGGQDGCTAIGRGLDAVLRIGRGGPAGAAVVDSQGLLSRRPDGSWNWWIECLQAER